MIRRLIIILSILIASVMNQPIKINCQPVGRLKVTINNFDNYDSSMQFKKESLLLYTISGKLTWYTKPYDSIGGKVVRATVGEQIMIVHQLCTKMDHTRLLMFLVVAAI